VSTKRNGVPEYEKADLDEPLFVLRAQDRLAPQVVRLYALVCTTHRVGPEKVESVRGVADQMDAWQKLHPPKLPD